MNGIHDMGGMDGFGPIEPEANEPVFHEAWEARVLALSMAAGGLPFGNAINSIGRPSSRVKVIPMSAAVR